MSNSFNVKFTNSNVNIIKLNTQNAIKVVVNNLSSVTNRIIAVVKFK